MYWRYDCLSFFPVFSNSVLIDCVFVKLYQRNVFFFSAGMYSLKLAFFQRACIYDARSLVRCRLAR